MQYHLFMIVLAECSSSYSLKFWIFCAVSVSVDAGKTQGRQAAESWDDSILQVHEADRCVTAGECVYVEDSLLQVEVD